MEEAIFDLKAARQALIPKMSRAELARKLGVSVTFLISVERGLSKLSMARRAQLDEIAAAWAIAPDRRPRKRRKDFGKKHRSFKLKGPRKPRPPRLPKTELVPVPHSHGEIVGIG